MNKLNVFLSSRSLTIYNTFSGLHPFAGSRRTDGTVFSFSRLDPWISTVVQKLTIENIRGSSRKKQYGNVFGMLLPLAATRTMQTARLFVDYWDPKELATQKMNHPSISENMMLTQWKRRKLLSSILHRQQI